jgi:hypothetical protein
LNEGVSIVFLDKFNYNIELVQWSSTLVQLVIQFHQLHCCFAESREIGEGISNWASVGTAKISRVCSAFLLFLGGFLWMQQFTYHQQR